MDPDHYVQREEHFARLIPEVTLLLSAPEAANAQEYLEMGEYGLALEVVVDALCMSKATISQEAYREIVALSQLMEGLVDDQFPALVLE
jgi:hypothetical protein